MIAVAIAFFASIVAAFIAVPVASMVGKKVGLVDLPDNKRKLHKSAIPLIGGIAVFTSTLVIAPLATWLGLKFQTQFLDWSRPLSASGFGEYAQTVLSIRPIDYWELFGLALGAAIILAVGVLDDRFGIRGRQKLFGQFLAASVLIVFGYHFEKVTFAGFTINFDVFSVLFVYGWVIAAINSVNLLDGADGIAGTIGVVMSVALGIMAIHLGQVLNAIIAFSFAGSLIGFLKFNFPPAKVYLGDAGSMLIGFILSALAIRSMSKQTSAFAFFAPLALLAIPFIDTAAAIIRRRLTGRSIFEVDRGHLHHNLMKRGFSARVSLLWVFLLSLTTAAGGVLSLVNQHSHYAMASIVLVVVVMMANRIFGNAEFKLVTRKANVFAKSILKAPDNVPKNVQQSVVHVQGNRDWNQLWQRLSDFADEHGLLELTLDLNAPWIHESFHATRRRKDIPRGSNHEWYTQIPLIAGERLFGRIELIGSGTETLSHHQITKNLLSVTEQIEQHLLANNPQPRPKPIAIERRTSGKLETDRIDSAATVPSNADQN
jgi:UDP-GlcNAc:undecaprenyl-phosphate GlcNAc-1-phosphate transferase